MKNVVHKTVAFLAVILLNSCLGEATDKLKNAKETVSNTTTLIKQVHKVENRIEILKNEASLTNEELKTWLPKTIDNLERSGFKVGSTGYANVASVEGTYGSKDQGRRLKVVVMDGAGPTGSIMMAGLGMASKLDMEEENENKHQKTVTINGIKAMQTYHKKRFETGLQFVHDDRFGVMINGIQMQPEETWAMVEKLNLKKLTELAQ